GEPGERGWRRGVTLCSLAWLVTDPRPVGPCATLVPRRAARRPAAGGSPALGALQLLSLPPREIGVGPGPRPRQLLIVIGALGGQLDDVAVRIAKVDGVDEAVIGDAARLH